jgi:hypothetical protein
LEDGRNHWRLPQKTYSKRYIIRNFPGRTRRVWVQPCWGGVVSARKFLGIQGKHDILRFMKCAVKFQAPEKIEDAVQNFIENPYFLRPQFLPSGRVTPEVSRSRRIEDTIDDSRGTGKWRSVEERINKRKKEGRKLLGSHPESEEEISYLPVSCDFLEDQVDSSILPEKESAISMDGGFYYQESTTKLPIEGPMTLEEFQLVEWQVKKIARMAPVWKENQKIYKPPKLAQAWKQWTPRRIDEDIDPEDQVPVTVVLKDLEVEYSGCWILRNGMEWDDFRFLANSKLGHDRWEALLQQRLVGWGSFQWLHYQTKEKPGDPHSTTLEESVSEKRRRSLHQEENRAASHKSI